MAVPSPSYTTTPPSLTTFRANHRQANVLCLKGAILELVVPFPLFRQYFHYGLDSFKIKTRIIKSLNGPRHVAVNVVKLGLQAIDVSTHVGCQSVEAFGADRTVGVYKRKRASVEGQSI